MGYRNKDKKGRKTSSDSLTNQQRKEVISIIEDTVKRQDQDSPKLTRRNLLSIGLGTTLLSGMSNGTAEATPLQGETDIASTAQASGDTRLSTLIVYKDGSETVVFDREGEIARDADAAAALQAADNAMSTPYQIHLTAGTYIFTGTYSDGGLWQINTDDVLVTGEGKPSEIRWDYTSRSGNEGAKLIEVRAEGVSFRDFYIDGQVDEILANGGTIDNSDDGHNIAVFEKDFTMQGVYTWYSPGDGVEPFDNAINSSIVNNHFHENWEHNVHLDGADRTTVVGNIMDGEVNNACVHLYTQNSTEGCIIADNVIRNSRNSSGIKYLGPGEYKRCIIANNTIRDNGEYGIVGGSTGGFVISGNHVYNNGNAGISPGGGSLIANNHIWNNGTQGIRLAGDCVVTGNYIRDNVGQGIWLFTQANNLTLTNNIIKNNGGSGISIKLGGDNIIIEDNLVSGHSNGSNSAGILVRSKNPLHDVLVQGNVCKNNDLDIDHQTNQTTAADHEGVYIVNNLCSGPVRTIDREGGSGVMSRTVISYNHVGAVLGDRLACVFENYGDYKAYSGPPPTPFEGIKYLDDGSNRADSNVGYRMYDGSSWVDIAG